MKGHLITAAIALGVVWACNNVDALRKIVAPKG